VDSCALPNNNLATGLPYEPGQAANGCFPGVTVHGQTAGANLASIMDRLGPVDVQIGSVVSLMKKPSPVVARARQYLVPTASMPPTAPRATSMPAP
jgi:hypothetical protein